MAVMPLSSSLISPGGSGWFVSSGAAGSGFPSVAGSSLPDGRTLGVGLAGGSEIGVRSGLSLARGGACLIGLLELVGGVARVEDPALRFPVSRTIGMGAGSSGAVDELFGGGRVLGLGSAGWFAGESTVGEF